MIDIVIGGQYGSEGKGKVTYWAAKKSKHKCVIRIGGPNSGHTAQGHILRHLPVSVLIKDGVAILGAGSYLNVNILLKEIAMYKPKKLYIDSKAIIIDDKESKIYLEFTNLTINL